MPPLIDDFNDFLDAGLAGAKKLLQTEQAGAQMIYDRDKAKLALASDQARDAAQTTIAQIQAQGDIDRAKSVAAAEKFNFSNFGPQLASGFGSLTSSPYTLPVAIGVAVLGALYLARRA